MIGKWIGWGARGTALLVGLYLYGVSMALMVRAGLGLDPWDVFHQGLSMRTGMSIGLASAVTGVVVLLMWIPLRNKPGIGTIANIIVIAIAVDSTLAWLPESPSMAIRVSFLIGGVALNAIATVLYVGAGLGPGPRDGLTTGLVHRTGRSVRLIRTIIEVLAVGTGVAARRERGRGHRALRAGYRAAHPARTAVGAAAAAGRQRLGFGVEHPARCRVTLRAGGFASGRRGLIAPVERLRIGEQLIADDRRQLEEF